MSTSPLFFISAAEHSGDLLGGALIRALRLRYPDARFVGVGGPAMAEAGCELLADPTDHSAMLTGAFGQVGYWYKLMKVIDAYLRTHRPAVVIPIDSPTINLRIARKAKRHGLKVCYYVAPQMWAWGAWRIERLRRDVDRVCAVLPFEPAWFAQRGVACTYVGHPMFDQPGDAPAYDPAHVSPPLATPLEAGYRVALLPGSRSGEVKANLPIMLAVIRQLRQKLGDDIVVTIASASAAREEQIVALIPEVEKEDYDLRPGCTDAIIRWADVVLTVSGTATLQVAKHQRPMIILYALPAWKWWLVGRWLVQTPYLSLVNILAGEELVPEYMPFWGKPDALAQELADMLQDLEWRQRLTKDLATLTAPLHPDAAQTAAGRVAGVVAELYGTA